MPTPELYLIKTDLTLVRNDIDRYKSVITKLESSIEKLTDAVNQISKILSLHEQKLQNVVDSIKSHDVQNDKQELESEKTIVQIQSQIKDASKDLLKSMEMKNDTVNMRLDGLEKETKLRLNDSVDKIKDKMEIEYKKLEEASDKLKTLERLQWMLISGGTVVGYILTYIIPTLLKFIGKI